MAESFMAHKTSSDGTGKAKKKPQPFQKAVLENGYFFDKPSAGHFLYPVLQHASHFGAKTVQLELLK